MKRHRFVMIAAGAGLALTGVTAALAQSSGGTNVPMRQLLENGFEIKAAAPDGNQYVVFLQRDTRAFACIFVTVTNAQCREIRGAQ